MHREGVDHVFDSSGMTMEWEVEVKIKPIKHERRYLEGREQVKTTMQSR